VKRYAVLLIALLAAYGAHAQVTTTPNLGLQIPAYQQNNWQVPINFDISLLDTIIGGAATLPAGATPTIGPQANWTTNNFTTTTITNFVGGTPQQNLRIFCGSSDTFTSIAASANISIPATFGCQPGNSVSFVLFGSVWYAYASTTATTGGTVTSVTVTVPSWLTATGCTITTSGTCAITGTSESANLFLASPNGSSGAIAPRAIVAADLTGATFYQTVAVNGTNQSQQTKLNIACGTNMTCTPTTSGGATVVTLAASSTASTAWSGITAATNSNSGSFLATGNTWDFSGSTLFRLRVGGGCTTSVTGDQCFDSTNGNWRDWNGANMIRAEIPSAFVSGDCAQPTNVGGKWTLADAGAPCPVSGGTSSMTVYNTPASATHTGIGPITMFTVGASDANYVFNTEIVQTNTTSGCASSPHVLMTIAYTQAQQNIARTMYPIWYSENGSGAVGVQYWTFPLNSAPVNNVVGWGNATFRAKAGTTISYTTSYTAGSCSVEATYAISPNLVAQ
jgi:hypothetical protein